MALAYACGACVSQQGRGTRAGAAPQCGAVLPSCSLCQDLHCSGIGVSHLQDVRPSRPEEGELGSNFPGFEQEEHLVGILCQIGLFNG